MRIDEDGVARCDHCRKVLEYGKVHWHAGPCIDLDPDVEPTSRDIAVLAMLTEPGMVAQHCSIDCMEKHVGEVLDVVGQKLDQLRRASEKLGTLDPETQDELRQNARWS